MSPPPPPLPGLQTLQGQVIVGEGRELWLVRGVIVLKEEDARGLELTVEDVETEGKEGTEVKIVLFLVVLPQSTHFFLI